MNKTNKMVRCVNLERGKVKEYSESTTEKDWFKKGGWIVQPVAPKEYDEQIVQVAQVVVLPPEPVVKEEAKAPPEKKEVNNKAAVPEVTNTPALETSVPTPEAAKKTESKPVPNAAEIVLIVNECSLEELKPYKLDTRPSVVKAVEKRLTELSK